MFGALPICPLIAENIACVRALACADSTGTIRAVMGVFPLDVRPCDSGTLLFANRVAAFGGPRRHCRTLGYTGRITESYTHWEFARRMPEKHANPRAWSRLA